MATRYQLVCNELYCRLTLGHWCLFLSWLYQEAGVRSFRLARGSISVNEDLREGKRSSSGTDRDSCLGIWNVQNFEKMEQLAPLRHPMKIANIPWRNNNLSQLYKEPPLSEQGETAIGVYLLLIGRWVLYVISRLCFSFELTL